MTIALLTPDPRLREFTPTGVITPGALLYTYEADSSTPLDTFSDFELTTPNANPVEADAGGLFGPIYLRPGTQYRYVLTTALGVPLWEQDHVGTGGLVQDSFYNVKSYGATGGGVVNDAAAIQAAIDACVTGGGGVVFFPKGTYRCIATLTLTSGGVTFLGEGASLSVIQWTDAATKGLTITGAVGNNNSALTANVAVGTRTLAVTSASGMAVGQFAYVEDSAANTGSWISRIQEIVGLNVTLEDSSPCILTTGNTVKLFAYTTPFLSGIVVQSLGLTCVAGNGTTNKLTLLQLTRCEGAIVENCAFDGAVAPLLTVLQCFNSWFRDNSLKNALTVAGTGIEVQTSTGCSVEGNMVDMCQFGISTVSSPWMRIINNRVNGLAISVALGRGIKVQASSNFAVIADNNVSDTQLFGIYNVDSADVTIENNTVSFSGAGGTTQQHGIAVGGFENDFCIRCRVIGNTVNGYTGSGIFVLSNLPGADLYATIQGNIVSRGVQRAVYIGAHKCTIVGNILSGDGATNFQVLNIGVGGGYCIIEGNQFDKETTPLVAIFTTSGDGNNIIGPNQYNGLVTTLLASDTTYLSKVEAQQPAPKYSTTQVATDANLTEKTAWTFDIAAGLFTTDGQGFRYETSLQTAANGNGKTITFYVGAQTIVFTRGSNNESIRFRLTVVRTGATAAMLLVEIFYTGAIYLISSLTFGLTWANAITVKTTMTNGVATAGDITFNHGYCSFEGIPTAAFV